MKLNNIGITQRERERERERERLGWGLLTHFKNILNPDKAQQNRMITGPKCLALYDSFPETMVLKSK